MSIHSEEERTANILLFVVTFRAPGFLKLLIAPFQNRLTKIAGLPSPRRWAK
jgi:hypothetical protein